MLLFEQKKMDAEKQATTEGFIATFIIQYIHKVGKLQGG